MTERQRQRSIAAVSAAWLIYVVVSSAVLVFLTGALPDDAQDPVFLAGVMIIVVPVLVAAVRLGLRARRQRDSSSGR